MKKSFKKILRYTLIAIILVVSVIVFYLFFTPAFSNNFEIVEINNDVSKETLYIQKESRGLSYEVITISCEKGKKGANDTRVMNSSGSPFFYKLSSDTLFLYGGAWGNIENNHLKTKLIYEELENIEFIKMSENYKERGLKVFPPSYEKFLN